MKTLKLMLCGIALIALVIVIRAQQPAAEAVRVDTTDIGGVVTSSKGPEAGVWVIAETTDLPTRYSKTVVTDDRGRYLIPDLPKANDTVWTRGYGLVDSAKTQSVPGKVVNLKAVIAPNAAAAAFSYSTAMGVMAALVPLLAAVTVGLGPEKRGREFVTGK